MSRVAVHQRSAGARPGPAPRRRSRAGLDGRRVVVVNISADDTSKVEVLGPAAGSHPVLALLGATHAPARFAGADHADVALDDLAAQLGGGPS